MTPTLRKASKALIIHDSGAGRRVGVKTGWYKTRNVIRRALTNLQVGNRHDVEVFISFCQDKLRGRGLRNYCQQSYCQRDIAECIARGFGRLLVASDPAARPATLTALDQKIEYFPVSTRRMRCENAAVSLVVRAALTRARKTEPGSVVANQNCAISCRRGR